MKRVSLLSILLLSFMGSAQALTTVLDPHGILPKSDQFLASGSFKEMVTCGQKLEQESENCYLDGGPCETKETTTQVVACSENEVTFQTISVDGTENDKFTKEKFDLAKGNSFRLFVSEPLDLNEITVTLESSRVEQLLYLGQVRNMMVINFLFDSCDSNGNCLEMNGEMQLVQGVPLVAQMKKFRLEYPSNFIFRLETTNFSY